MPGLQARQLVALGVHGALDVARCEDCQRLLQRLGNAPVVHDQAVGFLVGRAVHPRDGLQQGVLLQRRVQVHDLLDRRIEPGQQHVAHHKDRQRIAGLQESLDDVLALLLAGVVLDQRIVILVRPGNDDG